MTTEELLMKMYEDIRIIKEELNEIKIALIPEDEPKEEELRERIEQLLVCNGDFTPQLSALPKDRQTIYLRFQDFKAKVCKPFAR